MAKVRVPVDWMARSYLPPVCTRHGDASTTVLPRKFASRPPGWTLILLVTPLLIFALVALALQKKVATRLPACNRCGKERRTFIASACGGWVLSLALVVVGAVVTSGAALALGFVLLFAAFVLSFTGDSFRVSGHISRDGVWVMLKGVDDTFAAAVDAVLYPATATPVPASTGYQPGSTNILPGV